MRNYHNNRSTEFNIPGLVGLKSMCLTIEDLDKKIDSLVREKKVIKDAGLDKQEEINYHLLLREKMIKENKRK